MQFHWSDSDLRGQNDGCESLAPYVMALFDGEASEDQARRARAHLLVCQTCAHRWLDWNRSRDLLLTVPVPAPPPTLLWRVLMACRLAAFARKTPSQSRPAGIASKSYSDQLGAPDALRAQILARTTRTAPTSQVMKTRRAFPTFALSSMAVPALAMWLMVLQRDTFFVAQSPFEPDVEAPALSVPPERVPAAPRVERVAPRASTPIKKLLIRRSASPVVEGRAVEVRTPRIAEPEERFEPAPRERENAPEARAPRSFVTRAVWERPENTFSRPVALTVSPRPVSQPIETIVAPTPHLRTVTPTVRVVRTATLSDKTRVPRLRAARWELATPRVTRIVETASEGAQPMRVSVPSSRLPSARLASPAPTRLLAENFEGDDARVEEMRSVVDDFRAALAPDTGTDTDSEDIAG